MESLKAAARLIDDKPDYSRQFEAGMSVEADFNGEGSFYPGEVVKVHTDGACDVDYSDGDKESRVPRSRIRLLAAAAVKKAGEDLGLNENARGQSLHAKEAVGNRLARVEEATATSSSKPKPKPSSSSETVSRGQREGDTNLDEAKRNEEEDDEDEAEEDNAEEGNKAGSGAAGVLNEVGRPILAELVLHEVADKGSNAQVKSGGAAAAAAATLTDSEVATTGNSHLPPKPRALSDLPKGSGLRVSVLKLSQRETPLRELRAALKESAARLQSRVEGSGRDEESKEGNDGGGGGGGGSGFSSGSGSGLSGAELAVLRQSDFSGWTALHWAASTAQKEVTLELLALEKQAKRKLSLNKGHDGEDAQNDDDGGGNEDGAKAVGSGSESEEGARLVDARDELNGWTPLHLAAVGGSAEHFRVARALVESGRADLEAKDICGDAPRDVVSARGAALGDWKRLLSKGEVDAPTPRLRKAPDGKGGGGGGSGGGGGGDGDQHDRDRHHRHHRRHHHHDDDMAASDQRRRRRRYSGKSRDRSHHHHSRHDRARDGT